LIYRKAEKEKKHLKHQNGKKKQNYDKDNQEEEEDEDINEDLEYYKQETGQEPDQGRFLLIFNFIYFSLIKYL